MVINAIVGVYIPIIRIPIKGWMTIPNTRSLDPGTNEWKQDNRLQKVFDISHRRISLEGWLCVYQLCRHAGRTQWICFFFCKKFPWLRWFGCWEPFGATLSKILRPGKVVFERYRADLKACCITALYLSTKIFRDVTIRTCGNIYKKTRRFTFRKWLKHLPIS